MIEIERLDRRVHLSTTKLADAGGLPRQLTAVGDTVYFAVDSKADGHLSYVDLTAYNVKTKARASIRRADGTKFGKVEYTLARVDNRLRITELLGKGKTAVWSLKPGDSKAKKYAAPKSPVAKELAAGFAATATPWTNRTAFVSDRGVYTLNASTGKTYAVSVPFEKHLDHIASLGAVGDKLIVDAVHKEGEKLYVVDRTTGVGTRFRPVKDAGDANFVRVTSAGALVQAKVGATRFVSGAYQLFLTDGTSAGTTALTDTGDIHGVFAGDNTPATTLGYFNAKLLASAEFVQTDDHTLYFSNHAVTLDPTDPERAGPYVAPAASLRSGSYDSVSLVQVGGAVSFDDTGIFKLDLTSKTLTHVVDGMTGYGAGGLTVFGDSLYYTAGDQTKPTTGNVYARSLYRLYLPSATDAFIADAFEGAVFANGTPIVVRGTTSTTLDTGSPDVGSLQVDVLRDDAHAKSLDGETRMDGFSFYLDLNHDGEYQKKSEPLLRSQSYAVSFPNLAVGKYDVRLRPVDGWTATRGWKQTVTVKGGQPNVVEFGLTDDLKTGVIANTFRTFTAGTPIWIDADGDGVRDANERQTTLSATGAFEFDDLAAGIYFIHREGDPSTYSAWIESPGEHVRSYTA